MALTRTYTKLDNQTILDLCIIIYNSLDYLFQLMNDNNLNFNTYIPTGTKIIYDNTFTPNLNNIATNNGLWALPIITNYGQILPIVSPGNLISLFANNESIPTSIQMTTGTINPIWNVSPTYVGNITQTGLLTVNNYLNGTNDNMIISCSASYYTGIATYSVTAEAIAALSYSNTTYPVSITISTYASGGTWVYPSQLKITGTYPVSTITIQTSTGSGQVYNPYYGSYAGPTLSVQITTLI